MKTTRRSLIFGSLIAGAALAVLGHTASAQTPVQKISREHVPQELLVKFRPGIASSLTSAIHARLGVSVLRNFSFIGWQRLRLPAGVSVANAMARYQSLVEVQEVEPNYVWRAHKTANDPRFSQQYGLNKISAPAAWDTTTGSSNVVVAVIDTGVDYTHPDLSANMWRNPGEVAGNGRDDDSNGYIDDVYGIDPLNADSDPMDDDDHGTHCAGVIGAASNNSVGITGVNWSVRIMALKFLGPDGGSTSGAIKCFEYVTMMKQRGIDVRVTNNSWGGEGYSAALKTAMDTAGNAGVIHMAAAGNDGLDNNTTASYPANFASASVISVAASDSSDNRPSFSNYGSTSVDLAAPGAAIISTVPGGYASFSGTSMATPHVAGAAALLASYNSSLTVAQLRAALLNNVNVLPQWTGQVVSNGRLNLARALASVGAATPTPAPTLTPTPTPTPTPVPVKITALSDAFTLTAKTSTSSVAAPGVLANDSGGRAPLRATLVRQPLRGTIALAADGSFVFTSKPLKLPAAGTTDSFSYKATDGYTTTTAVTVKLKFAATTSLAASVISTASLAGAVAQSADQSISLRFSAPLHAENALDATNFRVQIGRKEVAVRSVTLNGNSLVLHLAGNTLRRRDAITVSWQDLSDANGDDIENGSINLHAG